MTTQKLVEALRRIKSNLMHQRRFGVCDMWHWRRAAAQAEGDIEEALAAHEAEQERAGEAVAWEVRMRIRGKRGTWTDWTRTTENSFRDCAAAKDSQWECETRALYTRPQQPLTRELKELEADLNELSDGAYLCPGWDVRRLRTALGITKDTK